MNYYIQYSVNTLSNMRTLELIDQIVESLNVLATFIFFALFCRRLCKIKSMGTTNRYLDNNWKVRFIFAVLYIFVSATILTVILISEQDYELYNSLLTSGSIGFCVNSFILMLHVAVLGQEIRKEIPFTRLHQTFLLYLLLISLVRLFLSLYFYFYPPADETSKPAIQIVILTLGVLLVIVSISMLAYWLCKKNSIPKFDDLSNVDIGTITERITNPFITDHSSLTQQKYSSYEKWNIIIPNVTVQLGKVRIILQTFSDDEILKSLAQEQTRDQKPKKNKKTTYSSKNKSQKTKQHLQIISDHLYTYKEIQKIYLICSRFNLESQIKFQGVSVVNFYRQIKKFIDELFTIKQSYTPEIFHLFHIQKSVIPEINTKVRKMIRGEEQFLVSKYVDLNALFLSVQLFKHLWNNDHYIFYIHAITMDQHESAVCYKRYNDFAQFNKNLQQIIRQDVKLPYKIPTLPKKHVFSWSHNDMEKVKERRKQLEVYCQETFNDFFLMTKVPRARQLILQFLSLKRVIEIIPSTQKPIQFYEGIQITKGNIYKALVEQEYVTFYEFQLFKNGIEIRKICKRFRQFIALHNSLQRWMENSQIFYKFVVLPEKHLFKSQSKRHERLKSYLQNILTIKQLHKIYAVNNFFNMGHRYDSENHGFGMSVIKKQPSDISEGMNNQRDDMDFSQLSDKQRMSVMIQELGEDN